VRFTGRVVQAPMQAACQLRVRGYATTAMSSDSGVRGVAVRSPDGDAELDTLGAELQRRPSLLARPQRWGVLPTWWFWQEPENARLIAVPGALLLIAATLGLILTGAPVWLVLLGSAMPYLLGLGLFERFIRRSARRRRDALALVDAVETEEPAEP
jgi:hypothetical protein